MRNTFIYSITHRHTVLASHFFVQAVFVLSFALLANLALGQVVINEIHYDPDNKLEHVEFIEFYNAGASAINLTGWYLDQGVTYTFPAATTLEPNGYIVVAQDPAHLQTKFGVSAKGPFVGKLDNEGEQVDLRSAAGTLIDRVDYSSGFPWPTSSCGGGRSMELVHPSFDNNLAGNWRPSGGFVENLSVDPVTLDVTLGGQGIAGIATASSSVEGWPETPDMAFDDDISTPWTASSGMNQWLQFQLNTPKSINAYSIQSRSSSSTRAPRDFRLEASNDGTNWGILDEQSGQTGADRTVYSITQTPAYAYYRIFVITSNDGSLIDIAEMELLDLPPTITGTAPTPGKKNSTYSSVAPPSMRQVEHSPQEPRSGEDVKVTVKVTDPDGVQSVVLQYQLVNAGDYIKRSDARYATSWISIPMHDDGLNGDVSAGNDTYTVILPASLQTHRRLVRYRITATDKHGASIKAPYEDDPQLNFAYFVYDDAPTWTGSIRPGTAPNVTYTTETMRSLPVYHLLSTKQEIENCTWLNQDMSNEYRYTGTLVYDGEVYDNIQMRARGGTWRYAMRKNMWKFEFHRTRRFQARDNYGSKYAVKWGKLNLGSVIQQGDYGHRGEQGLFESVGFKLFEKAGITSNDTNFVHFRIIDESYEVGEMNAAHFGQTSSGTQFDGDFWGLYLAVEQPNGQYLDNHSVPDGNLYKMEGGTGELRNIGPDGPLDKSDLNAFISAYSSNPSADWWRNNVDTDGYLAYRTIVESIHQYDIAAGKNYYYYLNPETGKWSQMPWDLDLTWDNGMYGDGNEPFKRYGCLNRLDVDYQNKMREVRDLLYNPDQTGMLIDEYASHIYTPERGQSFVEADRAMWDYHWVMANAAYPTYSNRTGKAGQGRFYEAAAERTFPSMVEHMKDYVRTRGDWIDSTILTDTSYPNTPVIHATSLTATSGYPFNSLVFETTPFDDPQGAGTFAAMKWRIAEVEPEARPWGPPVVTPGVELIAAASTWKYVKGTQEPSDPMSAWREVSFSHAAWTDAVLPIGYGENFTTTRLDDMRNNYSSVYLFRTFSIDDVNAVESLLLQARYDDGFNCWINGVHVAQVNVSGENIAFDGVAMGAIENLNFQNINLLRADPQNYLVNGTNVIAVQVLNASLTNSSDCFFDAILEIPGVSIGGGTWTPPTTKPVFDEEGKYEIDAVWESGEIASFQSRITIPASALKVGHTYRVRSRMKDDTGRWSHWSPPVQFATGEGSNATALVENLRISEVMYNPIGDNDYEYVELHNTSNDITIDLNGMTFTNGIDFSFTAAHTIAPDGYLLVVNSDPANDFATFRNYYGLQLPSDAVIAGPFDGKLSNSGERLTLKTGSAGTEIFSFEYGTSGAWPTRADGSGSSLELRDPNTSPLLYDDADLWRSSVILHGTPGLPPFSRVADVIINEVLTHTDPPLSDSIELLNATTQTIDLSGWYLSDSAGEYFKFRIPDNTEILAGQFVVFTENDFNPTPLTPGINDFALSAAHGDDVYLLAPMGVVYRFVDHVDFPAALNGESFGRWPDRTGALYPMVSSTLGSNNSGPRVGPVVITELRYHPELGEPDTREFVEISNPTGSAVDMKGWRLGKGVSYDFPLDMLLQPGEVILVVPFDPVLDTASLIDFQTFYGLSGSSLRLFGPWSGALNNGGEKVQLQWPDEPPLEEPTFVPYLIQDEVDYDDSAPWPIEADGTSLSLTRLGASLFGNDPASWIAAVPSPGQAAFDTSIFPQFLQHPQGATVNPGATVSFSVVTSATAPVTYQWKKNFVNIPGATGATYQIDIVYESHEGSYRCEATNTETGAKALSQEALLMVNDPPSIIMQPLSLTVHERYGASFSVVCAGANLTYQWKKDDVEIPGANASIFSITRTSGDDAGFYTCVITNDVGSIETEPAHLRVGVLSNVGGVWVVF